MDAAAFSALSFCSALAKAAMGCNTAQRNPMIVAAHRAKFSASMGDLVARAIMVAVMVSVARAPSPALLATLLPNK